MNVSSRVDIVAACNVYVLRKSVKVEVEVGAVVILWYDVRSKGR